MYSEKGCQKMCKNFKLHKMPNKNEIAENYLLKFYGRQVRVSQEWLSEKLSIASEKDPCNIDCICKPNYFRNKRGKCVLEKECWLDRFLVTTTPLSQLQPKNLRHVEITKKNLLTKAT